MPQFLKNIGSSLKDVFNPGQGAYDPNREAMFAQILAQSQRQAPKGEWGQSIGNLVQAIAGGRGLRNQGESKRREAGEAANMEAEGQAAQDATLAQVLTSQGIPGVTADNVSVYRDNQGVTDEALRRSRPPDPAEPDRARDMHGVLRDTTTGQPVFSEVADQNAADLLSKTEAEQAEAAQKAEQEASQLAIAAQTYSGILGSDITPEQARFFGKNPKVFDQLLPEGPVNLQAPMNVVNNETGESRIVRTQSEMARAQVDGFSIGESVPYGQAATNRLEAGLIDVNELDARLAGMEESFDPRFLERPFKAKMEFYTQQEKLGLTLGAQQQGELQEYTEFRLNTVDNLNRYIREITGAQMSEGEAERLMKGVPNLDDSPTQFQAKTKALFAKLRDASARYKEKLNKGRDTSSAPEQFDPNALSPDNPFRAQLIDP